MGVPDVGAQAAKRVLRKRCSEARLALGSEARGACDRRIRAVLAGFSAYASAPLVLAYLSYRDEVDTIELAREILATGRRLAVPRCAPARHEMTFFEITSFDDVSAGYKGILEPAGHITNPLSPADADLTASVCLVPALAFDRKGFRLGYGGGYYDRFLAGFSGLSIGLARASQISGEDLPIDRYDQRVSFIATDEGILDCRGV